MNSLSNILNHLFLNLSASITIPKPNMNMANNIKIFSAVNKVF